MSVVSMQQRLRFVAKFLYSDSTSSSASLPRSSVGIHHTLLGTIAGPSTFCDCVDPSAFFLFCHLPVCQGAVHGPEARRSGLVPDQPGVHKKFGNETVKEKQPETLPLLFSSPPLFPSRARSLLPFSFFLLICSHGHKSRLYTPLIIITCTCTMMHYWCMTISRLLQSFSSHVSSEQQWQTFVLLSI